MAEGYDQDNFWNPTLFNLETTAAIEFGETYTTASNIPTFSFEDTSIQNNWSSVEDAVGESSARWHGQRSAGPTSDSDLHFTESPQSNEKAERVPKVLIDPLPHPKRRSRKPPSGEALKRRRQQNRAAQLAFRERNKKQAEELRQELTQSMEYNHKMYSTMRELLEKTEALKRDIEGALALQPPTTSIDSSHPSRTHSLDLFASPTSSNGSPDFDYDAAST